MAKKLEATDTVLPPEKVSAEQSFADITRENYRKKASAGAVATEFILKFLAKVQRPLKAHEIQALALGNPELARALHTLSPNSHLEIQACGLTMRSLKNVEAAGLQLRARHVGGNLMGWYTVPSVAADDDLAKVETPESLMAKVCNMGYTPTALELIVGSNKYPDFYTQMLPMVIKQLQQAEHADATIRALIHRGYFESRAGHAMPVPEDPLTFHADGLPELTWNKVWGDCLADLPLTGIPGAFGGNIEKRLNMVAETQKMIRFKRKKLQDKADREAALPELERQQAERERLQAIEDAKPKATVAPGPVKKNFKNADPALVGQRVSTESQTVEPRYMPNVMSILGRG